MPHRSRTLAALCLLLTLATAKANNYGVSFRSHEVPPDERTSIRLCQGKPLPLRSELSLTFRMDMVRQPFFGRVFCLRTDDGHHIDGLFALSDDDRQRYHPALLIDDRLHALGTAVEAFTDMGAAVLLDKRGGKVTMRMGSDELSVPLDLSGAKEVTAAFGKHSGNNGNSDVAPIELWDVGLAIDGSTRHFWALNHHNDSVCYDDISRQEAIVRNGRWLLNEHVEWQSVFHETIGGQVQTAFDPASGMFYVANDSTVVCLNPSDGGTTTMAVGGGHRVMRHSNHLLFDPMHAALLNYNLEQQRTALMPMATRTWSNAEPVADEPDHYNHAVAQATDSTIYLFGGYGHYRYKNKLWLLSTASGTVQQQEYRPAVSPRAQAAAAVVGRKLYIFGGFGNESGAQEMPARPCYDLYEIDLATGLSRQLWQAPAPAAEDAFICASQMYFNAVDSSFYVATSAHRGELLKVFINHPQWVAVSASMDNDFAYKDLSFSLHRDDARQRMYVVVNKLTSQLVHDVQIYSIRLPLQDDNVTTQAVPQAPGAARWWWLAVPVLLAVVAGLAVAARRRKRRNGAEPEDAPATPHPPVAVPPKESRMAAAPGIAMLGGFRVTTADGRDITAKFSPRLRNLLAIILLNSVGREEGLAVKDLDFLLWQDMDAETARNNRNVSLHKLRQLLAEAGRLSIVSDKGRIAIDWADSDVPVDYKRLCDGLPTAATHATADAAMQNLLLAGPLLPEMSAEWLDPFKDAFTRQAIPLLATLTDTLHRQGDDASALRAVTAWMQHDPFSQQALTAKCLLLRRAGRLQEAHQTYDRFCRNYEHAMGEPFPTPLAEIMQKKISAT